MTKAPTVHANSFSPGTTVYRGSFSQRIQKVRQLRQSTDGVVRCDIRPGGLSLRVLGYLCLVILGNALGGCALPLLDKLGTEKETSHV